MSRNIRIRLALFGHGYGQIVTFAGQLFVPKVFVENASLGDLGSFMSYQAIGFAFAFFEFGIIQGFVNYFLIEGRESSQQYQVFQKVNRILLRRLALISLFLFIFNVLSNYVGIMRAISAPAYFVSLLAVTTMLSAISTLHGARYTVAGRDGLGAFITNSFRFFDLLGTVFGVIMSKSLEGAVLGIFFARCFSTLLVEWLILTESSILISDIDKTFPAAMVRVRRIGRTYALAAFGSQLAPNTSPAILASVMPAPLVATFFLTRTLSRIPVQFSSFLLSAVGPQFSRYFSIEENISIRRLFFKCLLAVSVFAATYYIFIFYFFHVVETMWLKKPGGLSIYLFAIMAISGLTIAITNLCTTALGATNHSLFVERFGLALPIATLLALRVGAQIGGLMGAGTLGLLVDTVCCIIAFTYVFSRFAVRYENTVPPFIS